MTLGQAMPTPKPMSAMMPTRVNDLPEEAWLGEGTSMFSRTFFMGSYGSIAQYPTCRRKRRSLVRQPCSSSRGEWAGLLAVLACLLAEVKVPIIAEPDAAWLGFRGTVDVENLVWGFDPRVLERELRLSYANHPAEPVRIGVL